MDNATANALLTVLHAQATAIEWVPAIVNLDFLPDMGRMNLRWLWEEEVICSQARMLAASAPLRCTA